MCCWLCLFRYRFRNHLEEVVHLGWCGTQNAVELINEVAVGFAQVDEIAMMLLLLIDGEDGVIAVMKAELDEDEVTPDGGQKQMSYWTMKLGLTTQR